MKPQNNIFRIHSRITAAFSAALLSHFAAPSASAQSGPYYWDTNGNTGGFGPNMSGTWSATTAPVGTGSSAVGWSNVSTGNATLVTATTTTSDDIHFGNGTQGFSNGGTLTVSGTVAARSLTFNALPPTSGTFGAIVLSGGTITMTGTATITRSTGPAEGNTIQSVIAGAGTSLTLAGTSRLNLTGANTYAGQTVIQSGTVAINTIANYGASPTATSLGAPTTQANGKIQLGWTSATGTLVYTGVAASTNRNFQIGQDVSGTAANGGATIQNDGGTLTFTSPSFSTGNNTSAANYAGSRTLTIQGAGDTNIQGIIWNNNNTTTTAFAKSGTGTVTLSGANVYTGGTTVNAGILVLNGNNSAMGGAVTIASQGAAGATLQIGHANALGSGTFTIGGTDGNGKFANTSGSDLTISNAVRLDRGVTFQAGNNVNFSGAVTLGTLVGTGIHNISVADGGDTLTFSGNIGEAAATKGINKIGAGKMVLSGTNNTYTGATTVGGGVLAVNGSLANTSTTVGNGGTLQGSGSIAGSVTVQNGGTLATGNSIESLATGALELQAGSTFAYELNNDAAAGVAGDLTAVTGNLTLDLTNGAILTLSELGSGSWTAGDKLTLISYTGAWNGGLFNYGGTLADDSTITFSGMEWSFNYNDTAAGTNYTGDLTSGSFVTMTAIPEPRAALLGSLGMLALLRRRRR